MRQNDKIHNLIPVFFVGSIYMISFFMIENRNVPIHIIQGKIDNLIPFCEYFIVPYLLWFVYVSATVIYFACFNENKEEYKRLCISLLTGMIVFIIISYTGSTKDNILVAKLAKQSGAKVVCISHFRKSPLTAYADVTLLCGADVSPLDGGSMTVKVGQLYLTDLLYQEYYSRNYKVCRKNNEKTSSAVLDKLF